MTKLEVAIASARAMIARLKLEIAMRETTAFLDKNRARMNWHYEGRN